MADKLYQRRFNNKVEELLHSYRSMTEISQVFHARTELNACLSANLHKSGTSQECKWFCPAGHSI